MKTSELTGIQLDYWTAKAQGWKPVWSAPEDIERGQFAFFFWAHDGQNIHTREGYSPTTNWAQCGLLIEEFSNVLSFIQLLASIGGHNSSDLRVAICRAIVASVFGEEMEE